MFLPLFAAVSVTDTTMTPASTGTPVEGSNGLLLEIDGKLVPNYAATMVSFDEGDVVKGRVVRIDKDEVLVDIGYKSENVIPSTELSIRKSVDPADEVELGEELDALVLTKEDAEGRLVLSKKRARFFDRISRPSASSLVSTSASTWSPSETSSPGSTERRIDSSMAGMTPSDL